jgi:acyl-CoA thioesterase II
MGSLSADSAVTGGDGRWAAKLAKDWTVWDINGGYVAAVMLQACGADSVFNRPASLSCHFLSRASPGEVEVRTERLRRSRDAESLSVEMTQGERIIARGLVWLVADHLAGLTHEAAVPPIVPPPRQLLTSRAMLTEEQWSARPPIWHNLEERPIDWPDDWESPTAVPPRQLSWVRFVHEAEYGDEVVDVGRSLILLDLFPPVAAFRAYDNARRTHTTMSLDLNVTLHRSARHSPWLLVHATAPVARDGLVAGRAEVWSESGELIATSTQQLLCRPVRSGG